RAAHVFRYSPTLCVSHIIQCPTVLCAAVDGWLARRLGLTSRFAAWLDVAVDNLGRGMLWSLLLKRWCIELLWGWMVSALEWCVFMDNTTPGGAVEEQLRQQPPTRTGFWVVGGLPPCVAVSMPVGGLSHWLELPLWIQHVGMLLLVAGRVLALSAEVMWQTLMCLKHEPKRSTGELSHRCFLCRCGAYGHTSSTWKKLRARFLFLNHI
uniref:Uncharacterized protein n=1 Tax=Astatotilapia calliptera TaxID=8154 RepID=A0AAX7U4B7_ASTCA